MTSSYLESLLELWDLDSNSTNISQLALLAGVSTASNPITEKARVPTSTYIDVPHKADSVDANVPNSSHISVDYSSGFSISDTGAVAHTQTPLTHNEDVSSGFVLCQYCNNKNDAHGHWCIECGTALASTESESRTPHLTYTIPLAENLEKGVSNDDQLDSVRFSDDSLLAREPPIDTEISEVGISTTSECLISAVESKVDVLPCNSSLTSFCLESDRYPGSCKATNPKINEGSQQEVIVQSSQLISEPTEHQTSSEIEFPCAKPSKKPSRRWSTSGHYMWRKPSTLHKQSPSCDISKQFSTISDCNGELQARKPSVPILELGKINECVSGPGSSTSSSSSLRRIVNKIHHSAKDKCCLELLPDELLLHIFSFLNEADLINCMYVCSRFYFISLDQHLWKRITVKGKKLEQKHLMSLVSQHPSLETLTFEKCKQISKLDLQAFFKKLWFLKNLKCIMCDLGPCTGDRLLLSAAMNCPQLHTLEFDWTTLSEKAIVKSIQLISRLEGLTIHQHGILTLKTLHILFDRHRQWLRWLNIGVTTAERVLASIGRVSAPCLETFVANFDHVDTNITENLQHCLPALKSLHIHHYCLISFSVEVSAQLASMSLSTLHLKLCNDSALGPECCERIARMSSLSVLRVDCVDDNGCSMLCTGDLSLEVLDLSNSSITAQSLSAISESSFRLTLKVLKLNGCVKISERPGSYTGRGRHTRIADTVITLVSGCPRLHTIEMSELTCANQLKKLLQRTHHFCKINC